MTGWEDRPQGRTSSGSRWRRVRKAVLARSTVCSICGHGGSDSADHVLPVTEYPQLEWDFSNLAPIHHTKACVVCARAAALKFPGAKPPKCSYVKGYGTVERARRIMEERTGLKFGVSPDTSYDAPDLDNWW